MTRPTIDAVVAQARRNATAVYATDDPAERVLIAARALHWIAGQRDRFRTFNDRRTVGYHIDYAEATLTIAAHNYARTLPPDAPAIDGQLDLFGGAT